MQSGAMHPMQRCNHRGFRRLLQAPAVAALLAMLCATAASADPRPGVAAARAPASAAPEHVSHKLQQLFERRARSAQSMSALAAGQGIRASGEAVLLDVVLRGYTEDLERRIEAAGGKVRAISPRQHRVSVAVGDAGTLDRIAALPEVQHIYPDYGAVTRTGAAESRAFEALEVDAIADPPANLTGTGQKVGILSDSFARTSDVRDVDTTPAACVAGTLMNSIPQESEDTDDNTFDLPASIEILADNAEVGANCPNAGSLSDEGTAMAELVHDLAPDAELSFHTAFVSFGDFAAGIDDLCGPAGSTVVVDDVGYFAELMYQRDVLSRAAEQCVASGVAYFSAAGNNGDSAFSRRYRDIDPNDNDDDDTDMDGDGVPGSAEGDFHDWNPVVGDRHLRITLNNGEGFTAVLQWNQPALSVPENTSNGPQVDLDLYISRSDTNFFANLITISGFHVSSFDDQQAGDSSSGLDPIEIVQYTNTSGGNETVYLGIDHWAGSRDKIPQDAGTDLEFRLVFFEQGSPSYEYQPSAATMYGHPVADGVISVGAVPWWEAPPFDPTLTGSNDIDPESFTAKGGSLQHHFRPNGAFRRGTLAPQPTVAAVDGNNTTFFGQDSSTLPDAVKGDPPGFGEPDAFPNFFGTSAAAPNAAAVAALLLQAGGGAFTPAGIEAKLRSSATDVTGTGAGIGCDDRTGSGLVNAPLALAASDRAPVADAGDDQRTKGGRSVTLDGGASRDDNGIDTFRWTQVAGPKVSLSNPNGAQTEFDAPGSGGPLVFELRVTDGACLSDADRVQVTVRSGGGGSSGWLILIGLAAVLLRRCKL